MAFVRFQKVFALAEALRNFGFHFTIISSLPNSQFDMKLNTDIKFKQFLKRDEYLRSLLDWKIFTGLQVFCTSWQLAPLGVLRCTVFTSSEPRLRRSFVFLDFSSCTEIPLAHHLPTPNGRQMPRVTKVRTVNFVQWTRLT